MVTLSNSSHSLTMSVSDIGPILLIKMLTFTSVGPEQDVCCYVAVCREQQGGTWTGRSLCLVIVHQELLQDPAITITMMTMTRITVCHLVTLLLSLWVKVSTSPWSPASASLLARALATVISLHIYITIYISTGCLKKSGTCC